MQSRIKDLMNQMYGRENSQGVKEVNNTALDYNLLSKYTAFVAVDEEPVSKGDRDSRLQSEAAQETATKSANDPFSNRESSTPAPNKQSKTANPLDGLHR